MSFHSFSELIAMGGHGLYVWMAYGVALVIFVVNAFTPLLRRKVLMQELAQLQRREAREADHYEERLQEQGNQELNSDGGIKA